MCLQEKDLPINENVNRLKQLNNIEFNKNGKWYDGFSRSINGVDITGVKTGIELRVLIEVTYYNGNTEQYSYSFYEYDTDKDITDELNQFKHDTKSHKSWKYI